MSDQYWRHRSRILERARIRRRLKGIPERVRLSDAEREQRRLERLRRRREQERLNPRSRDRDPEKRRAQSRAAYWRNHDKEIERMRRRSRVKGIPLRKPRQPKQIKLTLRFKAKTKAEYAATARKKYRLNPGPKRQQGRQWARDNPNKVRAHGRAWRDANRSRVRALKKALLQTPKGKSMRRKAHIERMHRLFDAIPPWADREAIERFYAGTPEGCHVDHVIPLANRSGARTAEGFLVCGLHCEANLQYLPALENSLKSAQMRPFEQAFCEGRLAALPTSV